MEVNLRGMYRVSRLEVETGKGGGGEQLESGYPGRKIKVGRRVSIFV